MKKNLFFLAIALIGLMVTSCNKSSEKRAIVNVPVTVSATVDTTINQAHLVIKTAPRRSCSGARLENDQLLSVDSTSTPVNISKTVTKTVDMDCKACLEANGIGVDPDGSISRSSNDGFWDGFWKVLAVIGAIVLLIWLISNWPKRNSNSSSSKTESFMNNSAKNPGMIDALNLVLINLRGTNGTRKGLVKYNHPIEGFEVVAGKPKTSAGVYIKNSGSNVNIYVGNKMQGANSGNVGVVTEPKKDEPATPAT